MKSSYPLLILVSLLMVSAYAQPDETKNLAQPIHLEYRSILTQYQVYREQTLTPWVAANDTVARIGGWRIYAKEAQQAASPQPAAERETTQ